MNQIHNVFNKLERIVVRISNYWTVYVICDAAAMLCRTQSTVFDKAFQILFQKWCIRLFLQVTFSSSCLIGVLLLLACLHFGREVILHNCWLNYSVTVIYKSRSFHDLRAPAPMWKGLFSRTMEMLPASPTTVGNMDMHNRQKAVDQHLNARQLFT